MNALDVTSSKWGEMVLMKARAGVNRFMPRTMKKALKAMEILCQSVADGWIFAKSTVWVSGQRPKSCDWRDVSECFDARVTKSYHNLEKGLTLPRPRPGFGSRARAEIESLLEEKRTVPLMPTSAECLAREALEEHDRWLLRGEISDELAPLLPTGDVPFDAGEFAAFFTSRRSVRNFDANRVVNVELVRGAIELASHTPSVCNRRAYRAHLYSSRCDIDRLLDLQNGNRGFGASVPMLAVVTERRSSFVGAGERNQRWVDGGMFAMSLVLCLHAQGLASCFLNWSQTVSVTQELRVRAGIPKTEDVIVLIAIGWPAQQARVARSPLRPVGDWLVEH